MTDRLPQRKSPRLADYDYSQNGAYFLTICTHNRLSYFGHITNQQMYLNAAGEMIRRFWNKIPEQFVAISCDYSVVMPNHLHGILEIRGDSDNSIIDAMQWFKGITTQHYGLGVRELGWQRYQSKLWQRSFHDHIIRDEIGLKKLREYVICNPALWEKDRHYIE